MTYYDVMDLCYFYVVFRNFKSMSLFNIHSTFARRFHSFFQSILEKHLNYKGVFWTLQAF